MARSKLSDEELVDQAHKKLGNGWRHEDLPQTQRDALVRYHRANPARPTLPAAADEASFRGDYPDQDANAGYDKETSDPGISHIVSQYPARVTRVFNDRRTGQQRNITTGGGPGELPMETKVIERQSHSGGS